MFKIQNDNIQVGDVFKGKINNALITIKKVDVDKDEIIYECNKKTFSYGLNTFKRCLLEKIL